VRTKAALQGDVVVVSPHLDDAALSLGAAISRAARTGARVTILTVLAGDPGSNEPAGEWDRSCGFTTAAEAARARRREDELACRRLGARPVWLPYGDEQYERVTSDDEIRASVVEVARAGLVLLPGFPLTHDDHRWLHGLLADAFPRGSGLYAEQPYAALDGRSPPEPWARLRAGLRDRRRKLAAFRAYTSQHEPLGKIVWPVLRYELRSGGESAFLP
jgi:LmbE family N-acetylglucosaminyl deacetylase